ncbi:MAG: amine dehydrogenase [Curvibacter sp.]|nr:MAG: amine dehydrogenase [Curvibacter sp.]
MKPSRLARLCAGCLVACLAAGALAADLPNERQTIAKLDPDATHRVYLADLALSHIADGRLHVIDGQRMRYLSAMSTGFAGQVALSPDRRELYVASTYYPRLYRGQRSDVVEVYGTDDLVFRHEIEIPPKHAQAMNIRATLAPSADGRWLLVQNATPASSVSVVDLQGRKLATEVPTPGCWGVIPWPGQANRFSTVCGDGTLATIELDEAGQARPRSAPVAFFDADTDPVFIHYERVGNTLYFVSYGGQVHRLQLQPEGVQVLPVWSLLSAAERKDKQRWRPGGMQLFAIDPERQRLFVGMHAKAADGSHKNPAQQIWVFDLERQARVARWPGHNAVSMVFSPAATPRLFVLDGAGNHLLALDPRSTSPQRSTTLGRLDALGETPVYLEVQ